MCFVTAIATFSYYAMLSGQGWLITPACRQLFYVRYIEWISTTPLLMLVLGMLAEADTAYLLAVMGGTAMMIFGGLMATISSGHIKWLWFVLALGVFFALAFVSDFHSCCEYCDHSCWVMQVQIFHFFLSWCR